MKYSSITAFLIILISYQVFALDHIILRDGQEFDVKLSQITNDRIVFSRDGKRSVLQEEVATTDVYMVYIENQGNIYLSLDGTRKTGEIKHVDNTISTRPTKFRLIINDNDG